MDAVTVLTGFVMFFHGSQWWLNPRSSLLFVCILSLVLSHIMCSVILTKVVILTNII